MNIRHRDQLGDCLNAAGLVGHGVEVGVFAGLFSAQILSTWEGKKLWGVDPFVRQDPAWYTDLSNNEDFDRLYALAQTNLAPHSKRYEFLRMTSLEAADRFTDATLSFVYIDANHRYEAVSQDLRAWWPKVTPGGWFCGHDFYYHSDQNNCHEASRAVTDFARQRDLCFWVTMPCSSWFIVKP